ncbi:hypothetical protein CHUAL_004047 [Chamberlinius hualienensis]
MHLLIISVLIFVISAVKGHPEHVHFQPKIGRDEDLTSKQIREDREHLKEDIEKYLQLNPQVVEHATMEELEYFYFVLHDFDKNDKLDGSEVLKAISHISEHHVGYKEVNLEEISVNLEVLFKRDDLDDDGYLTYPEFITSKNRQLNQ